MDELEQQEGELFEGELVEGELDEILQDFQLVDGELEDKLNDFSLDEEHELLKLYELHGSLELAIQLELQTLLNDED